MIYFIIGSLYGLWLLWLRFDDKRREINRKIEEAAANRRAYQGDSDFLDWEKEFFTPQED